MDVLAEAATQTDVLVAIVVALVGAIATTTVGLLNYRTQRAGLTQQLSLVTSAQLTERFTAAFGQLESSNKAVRVGAVYALERIVRDSPADRANIASALATFVRESQPAAAAQGKAYVPVLKVRAPDVQAALDVLFRPPLSGQRAGAAGGDRLDLSRTDLRRASLHGADLRGVNLWGARLDGANLRDARLQDAVLSSADLGRFEPGNPRYLAGADLSGADLTGAQLDDVAHLDEALRSSETKGLPR